MTDDDKALCKALETMFSHRGDGIPTQYVNPDGHAAATRIRELSAELATVRELARDMAEALGRGARNMPVTSAAWGEMFNTLTRWQEHEGKQ